MSGGFRFVLSFGLSLVLSTRAYAVMDQLQDGRLFDNKAIAPAQVSCNNLCGIVVDELKGELIGLEGAPGWGQTDDQWCANHQVGTNPAVLASPTPAPSGAPKLPQCNVPLLYGDTSCEAVNRKLTHCKLHGSQIETQCLAYATTKEASTGEKVVMGMDIAATAACTTACVTHFVPGGQALILACQAAGGAASAAEIIQNLTSKSSGIQKIVGSVAGAAGGLIVARGIAQVGLGDGMVTKGNLGAPLEKGAPSKQGAKMACTSAIFFGAMTGLRAYNISQHGKTKQNACDAVQQLVSQSFAPGFSVPTTVTASNTTSISSGSTGSAGTSGATSATTGSTGTVRTSNTLLGNGSCTDPTCMSSIVDRVATQGTRSAATDAGLLKSSGLSKMLASQAASLPLDKMVKHLENGGTADALIGSALNGAGGSFGQGIAALARQAQMDAASLGGGAGTPALASAPMGGGGMAGGQGRGAGEENPFKLLGQGEQNLAGNHDMNFTKPPELNGAEIGQDGDIYHSSFSGSIFEIVSHKIRKATDRVDSLGYALPMNRALAGQR